jgi:hypothetical protein
MFKTFIFAFVSIVASNAFSADLMLKVIDPKLAQLAFKGPGYYLQNGAVLRADKIDSNSPYCYTWRYNFNLDASKLYLVTKTTVSQEQDSWKVNLQLDPESNDKTAVFSISCMTKEEPTAKDIAFGLNGAYELISK